MCTVHVVACCDGHAPDVRPHEPAPAPDNLTFASVNLGSHGIGPAFVRASTLSLGADRRDLVELRRRDGGPEKRNDARQGWAADAVSRRAGCADSREHDVLICLDRDLGL
jgi:hypothetical protein